MGLSGWHLLILALVAVLIFGGSGRISSLMGDVAKGIKSFRQGLSDDEDDDATKSRNSPDPKVIDHTANAAERERDSSKTR